MMNKMKEKINKLKIDDYYRYSLLLQGVEDFAKKHKSMSYVEFDYYVVHDMTLFSIQPDFNFERLDNMIHHIKKSTSAIKRIFNKPIIFLKDTDDVLPVENARIINQDTLLHLASHSQYVANITRKGLKPRKLLTRIYDDDYSIYENIIFCNLIDEILAFTKKNSKILNSLLYASNIMRFNILEKVNHVNYFLALGKLHTGYIRDFSQYFNLSKEMLHDLSIINKAITPRLNKPVYKRNVNYRKKLALKKSNIFLMQKDYRKVYKTYKYLLGKKIKFEDKEEDVDFDLLTKRYMIYVRILTIFSLGHFNFEMDPESKIKLNALDLTFSFKGWELNISNNRKKEIFLSFTKDKTYKIMLTSDNYDKRKVSRYVKVYKLDEIIVLNQFDEDYLGRDDVYISIEDIDSFRRIQQITLKGMVYSDEKRDICPFCGGKLHKDPYLGFYQCKDCMTQIKEGFCKENNQSFFFTDNIHLKKHAISKSDYKDDYWNYEKRIESLMYFRNITKINHKNEIICPYCKKAHE